MRGWMLSGAVLACVAACARPAASPTSAASGDEGMPRSDIDEIDALVERPLALAPREAPPLVPVVVTSTTIALPEASVVLPLVRPRAGGAALALADLAMTRNDPFDAAAQYRAILERRPTYAAYVQFRLAQAYLALGERQRALPLLRAAAAAPAPEGWAALTLLAELRAERRGAVAAVAELRTLAGDRVLELEAHLVHVVLEEDRASLLMQMAIDRAASSPTAACELAVSAVGAGYRRDAPAALERSCRDDVEKALAVAMNETLDDRTISFEWEFNVAAGRWDVLREHVHAGDLDAAPWVALAGAYLGARDNAVYARHKELASHGARTALWIAVELMMRSGQTRGVSAARLRLIASDLEPRFRVALPPTLLRRLDAARESKAD